LLEQRVDQSSRFAAARRTQPQHMAREIVRAQAENLVASDN
jgi:hypothetical protein